MIVEAWYGYYQDHGCSALHIISMRFLFISIVDHSVTNDPELISFLLFYQNY